jgi:5-formyltetrahydrofolate cyclo-ligase
MRCSHAMDGKASLRAELVGARRRRSARERQAAGLALSRQALQEWPETPAVAAYAAVGTEPPTRPVLDALREAGTEVWLPVVVGRDLEWATYEGWDGLVEGPASLLQPSSGRRPRPPDHVALWLVPALAVDRIGIRLGRGGGYYDRALGSPDQDRPARVVAVVYDTELLDRLPREPHDVPVDAALMPSGVVPFGNRAGGSG